MEVVQVLHMNGGLGENSYANNSTFQRKVISMTKPITVEAIKAFYLTTFPQKIAIADLGCSSGPNTLFIAGELIKTVEDLCKRKGFGNPEYQVFLNDLPTNDFNAIFKLLPNFMEELKRQMDNQTGQIYFTGVPGSFYTRVLPTNSLHFIHSSFSLHWLSQIPKGLEINKGNIHIASTSPPGVLKAYYGQFQNDFSNFLRYRAEELVPRGRMVLTILGKRSGDQPSSKEYYYYIWDLLATALNEMVSEGLIIEEDLNSFNIPMYPPSQEEVESEVLKEGSFYIDFLETAGIIEHASGPCDALNDGGYNVTKGIRAVVESMLVDHFGTEIIEDLFHRFGVLVANVMSKEKTEVIIVTVSLIRKG